MSPFLSAGRPFGGIRGGRGRCLPRGARAACGDATVERPTAAHAPACTHRRRQMPSQVGRPSSGLRLTSALADGCDTGADRCAPYSASQFSPALSELRTGGSRSALGGARACKSAGGRTQTWRHAARYRRRRRGRAPNGLFAGPPRPGCISLAGPDHDLAGPRVYAGSLAAPAAGYAAQRAVELSVGWRSLRRRPRPPDGAAGAVAPQLARWCPCCFLPGAT